MAKPKTSTGGNQVTAESRETTLERRVLNSNLSDEDKIDLIQLIGSHRDIVSIPSVWTPYPQTLSPAYREYDTGTPKSAGFYCYLFFNQFSYRRVPD